MAATYAEQKAQQLGFLLTVGGHTPNEHHYWHEPNLPILLPQIWANEILARQVGGAGADLVFPDLLRPDFPSLDVNERHAALRRATSRLNLVLARLAVRLGIVGRLHTHTARHTLAGHAAELGGLDVAQGMLGHSSPAMTARYAGPQQSAALLGVEQALYGAAAPLAPEPEPDGGGKVIPLFRAA